MHHVDDNDPDQENNSFIPNEFHLNIANAEVGGLLTIDLDAEKDQINEGGIKADGNVKNTQMGGGSYNPQFQGNIKARNVEIHMGHSEKKKIKKNNRKVKDLERKMKELSRRKEHVISELVREEAHPGKKRKKEVEKWLRDVRRREDDFKNRSSVSARPVEEAIKNIDELQEQGRFTDGLFDLPVLCTSELVGKTQDIKVILECLKAEKIGKIGVYGMGGIGKTAIMKHIHNHLLKDGLFAIWVTVSKPLNLKKLQEDIAQSIELRPFNDNEDEEKRSKKLYGYLISKRFVLILDDMWEEFSFEKVGIPEPTKDNGCKIVLTSRNLGVCNSMETHKEIQIMLLSEDEAWELFKEKVGGDEVLSSNLQDVAKGVLHECGRLPLAIITVGRALRRANDVTLWKNALDELRRSSNEIKGMETGVHKQLRFSYDHLRNDTLRSCFLYCALYPEDYEIRPEKLIEYWMGEGLIEERGNRDTELNKGHALLKELTDACMLEADLCSVKMHDLHRDMAILITRSNPHFVVKAGNRFEDPLKEDEWVEDVERISLMRSDIKSLPRQPNCPKLSTLFLQENRHLHSVPSLFFKHMKGLRVLDLSGTSIESLPESVAELENLRLLLLHCLSLKEVPSLRKMNSLRVLDLSFTCIKELPRGMEEMINLRRLDLSFTKELQTFQAKILPNLSSLEDLNMRESKWEWSSRSADNVTAGSEELTSLTRLTRIYIAFSDLSSFVSYVQSMKQREPENFTFEIKGSWWIDCLPRHGRHVAIRGSSPIIKQGSLLLPDKTQHLYFCTCNVSRLSKLPCLSNLKELKECLIRDCDELEFISAADDGSTILSTLEIMELERLPNLRALCSGVVSPPTLTNLKSLQVSQCDRLRNLISFKLLQHLRNLEFVSVGECSMMEEIIAAEDQDEEIIAAEDQDESKITLLKLEELVLVDLPELKRICRQSLICSSLEKISVEKCPQLRKLLISPLDNPTFAANGVIKGSAGWWGALEWDDPNTKTLLQPLFHEEDSELEEEDLFDEEDSELEEEEELEEEDDIELEEEEEVDTELRLCL